MKSKNQNLFANPDKSGQVVRKVALFGVVCMLLFAVVSCESAKIDEPENDSQTFYRYFDDERVYFEISSNQVVVQIGEGVTENDIKRFFRETASLQVSDILCMRGRGNEFTLIHFYGSNRNAIIQLANQLQRNETILFVGPVIIDETGKTAALTNQINVRLKDNNDLPILLEAIAVYDIADIREPGQWDDSRTYFLTVNYFSEKSALQIANELHRTRLFEWAEPNLLHFIRWGI